jgi:hypothetical protein
MGMKSMMKKTKLKKGTMRTKSMYFMITVLVLAFITGCKKDSTQRDCEKNSYGVVTLIFSSSTEKHSVVITLPESNARVKTISKGTASDTLHLSPGLFPIEIASLNDANEAITSDNYSVTATTCSEETINVSF